MLHGLELIIFSSSVCLFATKIKQMIQLKFSIRLSYQSPCLVMPFSTYGQQSFALPHSTTIACYNRTNYLQVPPHYCAVSLQCIAYVTITVAYGIITTFQYIAEWLQLRSCCCVEHWLVCSCLMGLVTPKPALKRETVCWSTHFIDVARQRTHQNSSTGSWGVYMNGTVRENVGTRKRLYEHFNNSAVILINVCSWNNFTHG